MEEIRKRKMIIFEDDRVTQSMYKRIFEDNYDLAVYSSYEEYSEKEPQKTIDIVIMDISLEGGYNGLEITKEFRKQDRYKDTLIICVTAHAFQRDIENALNAGASEVVVKPVYKDKLKAIVKNLLDEESST